MNPRSNLNLNFLSKVNKESLLAEVVVGCLMAALPDSEIFAFYIYPMNKRNVLEKYIKSICELHLEVVEYYVVYCVTILKNCKKMRKEKLRLFPSHNVKRSVLNKFV